MDVKRRAGIIIPSEKYMDQPFYGQVKKFLTRTSQSYQYSHVETSRYFIESQNFLVIPRWFPLEKYVYFNIEDLRNPGKSIAINHSIKPRDEIQERAMQHMMENECATMELMPGVGKTVISIKTIAERAIKTIVLVHLDNLVEQWRDRVVQFTDCKREHVSRLRSATMPDDLDKPIGQKNFQRYADYCK